MDSTLDDLMADGEVATTHRGTPPGRPWLPLLLVAGLALVMATTSALSAVFKAALYRYAVGAPVDPAFDTTDLSGAFQRR